MSNASPHDSMIKSVYLDKIINFGQYFERIVKWDSQAIDGSVHNRKQIIIREKYVNRNQISSVILG